MQSRLLSIGAVERDTGIARDTLRVWERRYGFPVPSRNDRGERVYPAAQLKKLQKIRRLIDQGMRPGKIVALSDDEINQLEQEVLSPVEVGKQIEPLLSAIMAGDATALKKDLTLLYREQGMETFIVETVAPLLSHIGQLWASGRLQVYEEHFASAQLTEFLNSKISILQQYALKPRVMLATLPGEPHTLGLLMVAALLSARQATVINLGSEVPVDQIATAAERYAIDILGVTFSGSYHYENIRDDLNALRQSIEFEVDIWCGGEGVRRLRKLPEGVTKFTSLQDLPF
jgi:MerR family transcriptional regulator, light-induced transcriptional regulator